MITIELSIEGMRCDVVVKTFGTGGTGTSGSGNTGNWRNNFCFLVSALGTGGISCTPAATTLGTRGTSWIILVWSPYDPVHLPSPTFMPGFLLG